MSAINVAAKSPFLLKDMLVRHAEEVGRSDLELIDASRGAANWQQPRVLAAWHALGLYAARAAGRPDDAKQVAGGLDPEAAHHKAFAEFAEELARASAELADGCELLTRTWEYLGEQVLTDRSLDRIVYEFAEAAAGRIYPSPPTLSFVQPILARYLAPLLFGGDLDLARQFPVIMCEGATTGIAQVAATLARNRLLKPGDSVAMWWPTYEPLRDLVERQLGCRIVPIHRDPEGDWALPPGRDELDKLRDPAVRLAIVVSPGNPVPVVTDPASLDALEAAAAERPDLLILGDYVYMHFLDPACGGMDTEIRRLPRNTIGAYSFSKDFGLAGARIGALLIHPECVAEQAVRELGEPERSEADASYRARSPAEVPPWRDCDLPLSDRLVADSRGVSFVHMSGLSTPLQALACLCACYDLVPPRRDSEQYFEWVRAELGGRLEAFYEGLGLPVPGWSSGPTSRYSTVIDLCQVAAARGGQELAEALRERDLWAFMLHLAHAQRVVLTPGEGFGAGEWSARVCFPSVDAEQCRELGRRVAEAVEEFARGSACPLCDADQQ